MHELSQRALKITMELNNKYHTKEEIIQLMSELTGQKIDESFGMFPPFYTDCGRNIHIGKNVFINAGCKFQDQGGIYIEDGVMIGHNAVLATINHMEDLEKERFWGHDSSGRVAIVEGYKILLKQVKFNHRKASSFDIDKSEQL